MRAQSHDTNNRRITRGKRRSSRSNKHTINNKIILLRYSDNKDAIRIPSHQMNSRLQSLLQKQEAQWCPINRFYLLPKNKRDVICKDKVGQDYVIELPPLFVDEASKIPTPNFSLRSIRYSRQQHCLQRHPMLHKLYPFQQFTVQYCLQRHGRILIADQNGLGKTVQALACALAFNNYPILIVCPPAYRKLWKSEVVKFVADFVPASQIYLIQKQKVTSHQISAAKIIIVSYEHLLMQIKLHSKILTVICDEAHHISRYAYGENSKYFLTFLADRQRLILLTARPGLSQPKQLFPLIQVLRPDIFKDWHQFVKRYSYQHYDDWCQKYTYNGIRNLSELQYILKKSMMIRRKRNDILQQLTNKYYSIISLTTIKSIVKKIKEKLIQQCSLQCLLQGQQLFSMLQGSQQKIWMRCLMLSSEAKMESAKAYLTTLIQSRCKMVVVAFHKSSLDQLEAHFQAIKCGYIMIDESTPQEMRIRRIARFHDQADMRVSLVALKVATGLNLTVATRLVFFDMHWQAALLREAESCTCSPNCHSSVIVQYLVGEDTVDPLLAKWIRRQAKDEKVKKQDLDPIPQREKPPPQLEKPQQISIPLMKTIKLSQLSQSQRATSNNPPLMTKKKQCYGIEPINISDELNQTKDSMVLSFRNLKLLQYQKK